MTAARETGPGRARPVDHSLTDVPAFEGVPHMLRALRPVEPVYCIHPGRYREAVREFVTGFPGRVLFAVKANDDPRVLRVLHAAGIRHFDCASLPEIELVSRICPGARCYFMVPVRLRGAAAAAFGEFGVRHFMVDDPSGLALLAREIEIEECVVFVRMAVKHEAALQNFSAKFGAAPAEVPALLGAVRERGAEPALAFNVGSSVVSPAAYGHALDTAAGILAGLPFRIRLLDVGGGFPRPYPGFEVPPLAAFFEVFRSAGENLPLAAGGELLAEPGRALAAPGLSAVVEVLLRKGDRLYINDGMYGIFWELRFNAHDRYPVKAYRDGRALAGETAPFRLFGPTCDGSDALPGKVDLPAAVRPGDYLEFERIGAYSLGGRTRFNGHYSEKIVTITGPEPAWPGPSTG